ncbi:unnamed protein product, partial [Ectocarpus sp. 13 AM-2016]
KWSKKAGTGKNENFHGNINRLVHGVSRMSAQACGARLMQRIHRHNLDMDRKHGRTSKQTTPWQWRERDANDAAKECGVEVPFPKAGPRPNVAEEHLEPMGFEYYDKNRADELQVCRNTAAVNVAAARRREGRSTSGRGIGGAGTGTGTGAGTGAGTE